MSAININKNNFQNEIMDSEKTVLLDFWAPWCAPCRMVVPIIEEIASERPDIKVGKINVDEQPELASKFGIMSIPTLVVMKNGKIVTKVSGARSNAHCHRNLLDESCIQVAVYDDRLEVTSPGGLYNGLTYEEVMNGHSKIRNKGIANIFSQMGLVEAWGSGIKRILNAAEEYGLPKPRFQEFDNMFRVELFRVNPITDQANQANQDFERFDQVEDENVLSEKEIEILNLVRMQPSITQKEMANALDWNLASVKYYITKLKEKKYLTRQGSSQKGSWLILTKRD